MFDVIKTNSYTIVKMCVNQFGMMIFGIMMSLATANSSSLLFLITGIFSACFYMFLLYTMCWDEGAKDKIRVDGGRLKRTPWKGFVLSCCANVLNLLLAILTVVGYLCLSRAGGELIVPYTPEWAANLFGVCNAIERFINAMYLGIIQWFAPNNPFALLLIPVPALLACHFGYFMGLCDKRILGFFGIKPSKKQEELYRR